MHCIFVLCSGYNIIQEEQVKSFWGSTFVKLKKTNFLLSLRKGKHRCIRPPPIGFSLHDYHYYLVDCTFTLQEFIETLECIITLCISLDPIVVEIC
jgi:hypothetical protein